MINNNRIKQVIIAYDLSNQQLADHMKIKVPTVESWIKFTYNPNNGNPTPDSMMLLVDLLIETKVII